MHYARGKTLGGSSARNHMVYHRATEGAYQQWADEVEDDSFLFQNLLPYYQRSCNLTPPDNAVRDGNGSVDNYDPAAFASNGGPLSVTWSHFASPFVTWVDRAMRAIGVPANTNGFSSGNLTGAGWVPTTITAGIQTRSSSQTSFLALAMQETGLVVYNETLAQRIEFEESKRATGVTVETAGTTYSLSARKEIILSAGAFQSLQMLMVSGIGPSTTLQAQEISIIQDLPGVGQNLWDQPLFGIQYRVAIPTASELLNNPGYAQEEIESYQRNDTGRFSAPPSYVAWGKLTSDPNANVSDAARAALSNAFPEDWPEVEYLAADGAIGYYRNSRTADPEDGFNYGAIQASIMRPLSRGNVSINSSSMADPPLINPNWLTDPVDVELAVAAFRRIRAAWASISELSIGPEYIPGPTSARTMRFDSSSRRTS